MIVNCENFPELTRAFAQIEIDAGGHLLGTVYPGEKISLEELCKRNPADIVLSLHPPELRAALQCLLDDSPDVKVPDWAKRAASSGVKFFMPPDERSEPYKTGWMLGLASGLLPAIRKIAENDIFDSALFFDNGCFHDLHSLTY